MDINSFYYPYLWEPELRGFKQLETIKHMVGEWLEGIQGPLFSGIATSLLTRSLFREAFLVFLLIDIDHNNHLDTMLLFSFAKVAQGSNE